MTGRTRRAATAVALAGATAIPAGLAAQSRCEFRDEIDLTGPVVGTLDVDAGAGRLVVTGSSAIDEIRVMAVLCASDRDRLEGLGVSLDGDKLQTEYPGRIGGWGNNYARIDLTVEVPAGMGIRVEDSSGSLEIVGVGDVEVRDGSGSMSLREVGSVSVVDGSGGLRIADVTGDVDVEDGSGSMEIRVVGGDVTISDGSGSIRVEGVGGTVRIDEVGSGGVSVRDVDGDLVVTDGRRERIRYSEIRGTLDLPPARRRGRGS
ncbi:MAG: hypothetical protein OXU74_03005 [Gemmatimonadota bacterium]|nr:hypothetical protein [Gemmatimonadota bacterium]